MFAWTEHPVSASANSSFTCLPQPNTAQPNWLSKEPLSFHFQSVSCSSFPVTSLFWGTQQRCIDTVSKALPNKKTHESTVVTSRPCVRASVWSPSVLGQGEPLSFPHRVNREPKAKCPSSQLLVTLREAELSFSVYMMLQTVVLNPPNVWLSKAAPPVVSPLPPTIELFWLLLHNCHFATVANHNVNICAFWWS